ncbi:MAG: YdcF family protein [Bacteroidetes bacterium]|nr:YdcF family protein [Bacteroidota bacterium]
MKKFVKILRIFLITMGGIFTLAVVLAFTSAPFWIWYNLSMSKAGVNRPPEYIVVLGGGGMPSETGLIRCWYTAKTANYFTRAKVIVALPGNVHDSLSSINGMKKELVTRGVEPERILLEDSGTNTRSEALNILKIISNIEQSKNANNKLQHSTFNIQYSQFKSILIVTSPEHLRRAVLTFRKAGFLKVDGIPAFEEAIESDITFMGKRLGGRLWVPDIGNNITLRYQFWTQLRYEELLLRELFALGYYKLKGWI